MTNLFTTLPISGAFSLGFLLGWLVYYFNRHRQDTVNLSDFGVIVGVVAGAAVTSLLGKAPAMQVDGDMFGAYAIGLLFGFFSYLAVMVFLVARSNGEYDSLYFVDGRRRKPDEKYDVPERGVERPLSTNMTSFKSHRMALLQTEESASSNSKARDALTSAIHALYEAAINLEVRQAKEKNNEKAHQMSVKVQTLQQRANELEAKRANIDFSNEATKQAAENLNKIAKSLNTEAKRIKSTTDALSKAAIVLSTANDLIKQVLKLA